jgi:hypothetical protein
MYKVIGGCHCGNLSYVAELPMAPATYTPRACDCDFCVSHGASYASDSKGRLTIRVKSDSKVSKYRMGSRMADFLICKNCGVLTNVCYEENGTLYGSINVRSTKDFASFGDAHLAHLVGLNDQQRVDRWKQYWFPDVTILSESG